jgi:hypothetical protein
MLRRGLVSIVLLSACPTSALAECTELKAISEEKEIGRVAVCPPRFAVSGVKCSGSYCDNVTLSCCRYMTDKDERGESVGGGAPDEKDWTVGFSEHGHLNPASRRSFGLLTGLQCEGQYCSSMKMLVHSPYAQATEPCVWLDPVSEQNKEGANCASGYFVSDMKCSGSYCSNISLQCCAARDTTQKSVVFSRPNSCVKLPRTGRGFSIAAEAQPPGIPTDLSKGRPDWICPSGFAMRGLECHGDYCSYLNATCCPYLAGGGDYSKPTYRLSRPFSEEPGAGGFNGVSSKTEFLVGVRCSGNNCDNIEAALITSRMFKTESRACHNVGPFSEENRSAMCASDEFVSGMYCQDSYCDNITLTCCRYETFQ